MDATRFDYNLISRDEKKPAIGLIVLQSDETIEREFRMYFSPHDYDLYVSRVPSAETVSAENLAKMTGEITRAAKLFPRSIIFDVVAYGCTSGTSVIGVEKVDDLIRAGCNCAAVSNPASALIWACREGGIKRLGFLSPYVEEVSNVLRDLLRDEGIETQVFGSFEEPLETNVAHIDGPSLINAALQLSDPQKIDGLFLSCTNLRTIDVLEEIELQSGLPCLSSNFVLAQQIKAICK